ncbi:MAG: PAS domain-containing protein [Flavobacteriaceae bacterium]
MDKVSAISNAKMLGNKTRTHQILPKCYLVLDFDRNILKYNSKCEAFIGLLEHKGEIKKFDDFLIGENKERFDTMMHMVQLKGCIEDFELEITKPCGQRRNVRISASAVYDSKKNAVAMHCLMSDVGKEQMFLAQLKEELGIYSAIFENAPFGIAVRKNGEFIVANKNLTKLLEYPSPFLTNHYLPNITRDINVNDYDGPYWVQKTLLTKHKKNVAARIMKSVATLSNGSIVEIFVFALADRHMTFRTPKETSGHELSKV